MQPKTNARFARANEAERIQNVLNEWIAAPLNAGGLTVLGVSGYGGVGKSFLLNSVLNEKKLENRDALVIRIDGGNNRLLTDFMGFVDEKLAPKMVRFKGSNPKDDQFPETRKLVSHQRKLAAKVVAEVEASDLPKNVKNAAKALYRFNPLISKIPEVGPAISKLLELGEKFKVEEYAEPAIELLSGLKSLKPSNGLFGKKLHLSPLERLAISPLETIAEAYETDIRARLVGYEGSKILKLLHPKAKGINRLLLFIDDYESTSAVLGDLLTDHLFPRFAQAPYPVLAIIAGRDDLRDADPEFSKNLAPYVRDRITLEPFTKEEAILFLKQAGYEEEEATKLYEESNGYPFVLSLLSDFKSNQGERPATFYQQFYERTTQWMTPQQKEWLLTLCYLGEVNNSSIQRMMPEATPALVMDWFRREASVRDVKSTCFRVDPYIRKMLIQHHGNLVGPEIQRDLIKKGQAASSPDLSPTSHSNP
jgi:hypothetical protein